MRDTREILVEGEDKTEETEVLGEAERGGGEVDTGLASGVRSGEEGSFELGEANEWTEGVGGGFPFGAKGAFELGEPERDGAAIAFFSGISVEGEEDREVV